MASSLKKLVLYPLLLHLVSMFRAAPSTLGQVPRSLAISILFSPQEQKYKPDSVPRPPEWRDQNSLQHVVTRSWFSKVLLNCKSTGDPAPEMFWTKDGVRIEKNSAQRPKYFKYYKVKSKQQQLVIKPLLKAHEGNYTCNISNKWGNLQHSIVVKCKKWVKKAPEVVEKPENQTVAVGMDIHLKCAVDMHPANVWIHQSGGSIQRETGTFFPRC